MSKKQKIGYFTSIMFLLGLVLGAGLWVTPVVATSMVGSPIMILAPLAIVPVLLLYPAYMTLSKSWSISGAHYYYPAKLLFPEHEIASQFVGWVAIWVLIAINIVMSFQFLAAAPAQYLHSLLPSVPISALVILFILLPLVLVRFGVRIVGLSELVFTSALLISLAVILGFGLLNISTSNLAEGVTTFEPSAAGAAFILMFGTVTPALFIIDMGSDIKDVKQSIDSLFLIAAFANILVASLIVIVIMGVSGGTNIVNATLHTIAVKTGPGFVVTTTGIGGFLAGLTTAIGVATVLARWARVAAEDGLLPKVLAKQNKYGEPGYLLFVIAVVAVVVTLLNIPLREVASTATISSMFLALPIAAVGFRLPNTFPEFFENEEVKNSRFLRPAIVRWSSLLAGLILLAITISLVIQSPLSGAILGATMILGALIYGVQYMQKGNALYQEKEYSTIQADD